MLVAEDNLINQKLISRLLEKLGATVVMAGTGVEAVQRFRQYKPDIILMDCQMPDMDGYEATKQIRKLCQIGGMRYVPIIALTANTSSEDKARCHEAGMDEFVTKPLDTNRLRLILQRFAHMDNVSLAL